MPIIAQQLITISADDDLTVTILDEIDSCGCIKTSELSDGLNIPLERLKFTLRRIAGIKCDKDYEICCTDEDTFNNFVKKLDGLK